jgi:hypothetical protein
MMSCDYCNELPDNCKCEPDDDRIDGHESRIDSLERIYGDLRSDITEHMKTSSQRRTELLASMAATIVAGLARHINDDIICDPEDAVSTQEGEAIRSERQQVAEAAVDIARRILAEVEK